MTFQKLNYFKPFSRYEIPKIQFLANFNPKYLEKIDMGVFLNLTIVLEYYGQSKAEK